MFESRQPSAVSHQHGAQSDRPSHEAGAVMIEYVMILGLVTALVVFFFGLLYPSAGDDIETLVNKWGDKIATEIAGDPIDKDSDAWGAE